MLHLKAAAVVPGAAGMEAASIMPDCWGPQGVAAALGLQLSRRMAIAGAPRVSMSLTRIRCW